jgi:PadR family transcriptional regulator, regulatory protein PadR
VQLHNRLEALLEEAHIKVSSVVSDLLGTSARRMLQAVADGETNPIALAALAAPRLRATPAQLCDAFQACPTLHPVYRRLLKLTLEELRSRDGLNASQGSLYPALHRRELSGEVKSEMTSSENNRRARIYTLTPAGRRRLDSETATWDQFALSMKRILQAG